MPRTKPPYLDELIHRGRNGEDWTTVGKELFPTHKQPARFCRSRFAMNATAADKAERQKRIRRRSPVRERVYPAWTDEDTATLLRLYETNISAAKIAAQMECSKNRVVGKLFRMKEQHLIDDRDKDVDRTLELSARRVRRVLKNMPSPLSNAVFPPRNCCQWPLGDPRHPTFRFCGAPVGNTEIPYCAAHYRVAYHPAPRSAATAALAKRGGL